MKFIITKNLRSGRYFVKAELIELTDSDAEKANKFGFPSIQIKGGNGKEIPLKIPQLNQVDPYGFYNQNEADEYAEFLKRQIVDIKEQWENLKDTWSQQEEL
jgi:hypothetical protein